ncbi:pilus assembly protein PilP [Rhodoferax sp.]|uniref:pilus assembly protein PilP n=1 Tax=Rhodoferax sp. TaxID=50421 RepID=UPI002840C037|nr:pilus assembly protein PilP [Rhodoferax sp.]MDR3370023.1 pilus assembly protein PilP [Rhodoferax sp.]
MTGLRWIFAALLPLVALTACSVGSEAELRDWMAQQKSQTFPKVVPLAEPKQFKPENYTETTEFDPFSVKKLTLALKRDSAQASSNAALLEPELARRKEPLEEFPLDTIAFVGSMVRDGKPVALVTVGKLLYQVHTGDHLGQNYGLITKIVETEITLREIVQDAAGEWIERAATLQLQERSK